MPYSLDELYKTMQAAGVTRLYAKYLRRNNNSKQQFYIAKGDWSALQIFTMSDPRYFPGEDAPAASTAHKRGNYKAELNFEWIDEAGKCFAVPHAQLILYPKYPEIRLGSLITGAEWSPKNLLNEQTEGRVLFLGLHPDGRTIGYMAAHDSEIAREFVALGIDETDGVLHALTLPGIGDTQQRLIAELRRIHQLDWIRSKSLDRSGTLVSCESPNCVGLTLEAELGIIRNGRSEPDYLGWEVKAHTVSNFQRREGAKAITLFTPNPDRGYFAEHGAADFLRKYGYADTKGIPDRINFGGVHKVGIPVDHRRKGGTVTTLTVEGYDRDSNKVTEDDSCGLYLRSEDGAIVAGWSCETLLSLWQKKHDRAVYVSAMTQKDPKYYRYGSTVRLGVNTDITYLFRAIVDGFVRYDPGLKLEQASTDPTTKVRHQFRIGSKDIGELYAKVESQSVL